MIVLDLCCAQQHRFEGWFASADAFASQSTQGLVSCPVCGSTAIERLPSAPYVQTRGQFPAATAAGKLPAPAAPQAPAGTPVSEAAAQALLMKLHQLSQQAEDVGERLPEEARRIHYGESEARDIRGQASSEEVVSLLEEGIMVLPLPPAKNDLH